jgi:hypothetical protein
MVWSQTLLVNCIVSRATSHSWHKPLTTCQFICSVLRPLSCVWLHTHRHRHIDTHRLCPHSTSLTACNEDPTIVLQLQLDSPVTSFKLLPGYFPERSEKMACNWVRMAEVWTQDHTNPKRGFPHSKATSLVTTILGHFVSCVLQHTFVITATRISLALLQSNLRHHRVSEFNTAQWMWRFHYHISEEFRTVFHPEYSIVHVRFTEKTAFH